MTPDDYQQLALLTWYKPDDGVPHDEQVNQAMLQLASEAGELAGEWVRLCGSVASLRQGTNEH